jgi:mannose-6-phosphate isomerase-like protein (cupin superfamily)
VSSQAVDFTEAFARLTREGRSEETTQLGGVNIRLVQIKGGGEGRWDRHEHTTETVVVWSGDFTVAFRDGSVLLSAGQCCVVPIGAEHRGTSKAGAQIVLFQQVA